MSGAARYLVVALVLVSPPGLFAATWKSTGPSGGTVWALKAAPSIPRVLYAGTGSGLFRSADAGESWSNTGFQGQWVNSIAIDPADENVVYAASGGVHKSVDGGAHWTRLDLPAGVSPSTILVDPLDRQTVYVGSRCGPIFKARTPEWHEAAGVYKSADGGMTWTRASEGLTGFSQCVVELALDPVSPHTLYVTPVYSDHGYARSDDGGRSWTRSPGKLPGGGVIVDPRDSRRRFGITSSGSPEPASGGEGSLLVSPDAGQTWNEISPVEIALTGEPQASLRGYYSALALDPETGRLFLGTSKGAYRSGDGGLTWLSLAGAARDSVYGLVVDSMSDTLLTATAAGVSRSDGYPWDDWTELPVGHTAASIRKIAVDPSRPGTLYALGPNRLYRTRDNASSWDPVGEPLPLTSNQVPTGRDLAVDARGDGYVLVHPEGPIDKLYRHDVVPKQWVEISPPKSPYDDYLRTLSFVTADPKSPGEVYAGQIRGLARTRDGGTTWERLPTMDTPWALAIDPSNTDVLYTVMSVGIAKSTDRGATWTLKTSDYGWSGASIAVSPVDPSVVYVATSDRRLAVSTDGGENWTSPSLLLGELPAEAVVADTRDRLTVYAGVDDGVIRSRDGGLTWHRFGDGLPDSWVSSLAIDPTGTRLHAAAYGWNGVSTLSLTRRQRGVRP